MDSTHKLRRGSPRGGGILADRSGAIVLISVFMCIFLVKCLWYLIGIGDAIVARERLDAGADAAAFCAAVYHARGMNMIAMFNLIIATTMAVIIFAKGLDYVIGVAYYTSRFVCAAAGAGDPAVTDPACKIAQEAGNKTILLKTMIDKADASGNSLLGGMSAAQTEIALVTPWVASTESTRAAAKYEPILLLGASVSPSMIPESPRLGLPVMDEDYSATCARGGLVAPLVIEAMVPDKFTEYVRDGSPIDVASRLPQSYCGTDVKPVEQKDLDLFDENDVCEQKVGTLSDLKDAKSGAVTGTGPTLSMADCVEAEKVDSKALDKAIEDEKIPKVSPELDLQKDSDPDRKTGKKMAPGAVNGNEFFQVYALAEALPSRFHTADKGVQFGSPKSDAPPAGNDIEANSISQAEFFYDQTRESASPPPAGDRCWKGGDCGLTWPEYQDNALWNMRWRARLRPLRMPPGTNDLLVDVLSDGVRVAPPEADGYIPPVLGAVNSSIGKKVPQRVFDRRLKLAHILLGK